MFVCQWHLDVPYSAPQLRRHSDALASYLVSGSQYWVVYRVISEAKAGAGRS